MIGRSRASVAVLAGGGYLMVVGLGLLLVPNPVLAWLGMSAGPGVWPRVAGAILVEIAILYLHAGRTDSRSFAVGSIYARLWIALTLAALIAVGQLPLRALLFPLLDAVGAGWTWLTLRSEHRHTY